MTDQERPESGNRGAADTLDLGIQAAFGLDPDLDAPTTRSILKRFQRSGTGSRITLRDPEDEHTPVALSRANSEEEPPPTISRYQVAGEIARGGIGSVLKARDADLGRDVALKVLLNVHRNNPEVTRRFLEEAQIGGQLQHPGIVPVHEIGVLADDRPYFAMKLVKGQTLAELLESRTDHNEARQRFLGVFEQVCQTLAYAHTRGVIHRDLKPSNIMVGPFGEVQVMDWGLAKVLAKGGVADELRTTRALRGDSVIRTARTEDHGSASIAGSVMGTPAYMPPEQARGAVDELDERSDVFGLGAILCEILTGRPPYTGRNIDEVYAKARKGEIGDALRRLDLCEADRELIELAASCLNVDPRARPRNGVVVAKRMRAHLESVERRAHELRVRTAKTRLKLAVALFVLLGVILGGGGYLWIDKELRAQRQATMEEIGKATGRARKLATDAKVLADQSIWQAALREAERAVELARTAGDTQLVASTAKLQVELEDEARDQAMVEKLEHLREELDADREELERSFREAFSIYEIDVESLDVEAAATRVRDSKISNELVLALDQWAVWTGAFDRPRRGRRGPESHQSRIPVEIAKRADTDPWRRKLRQAVEDGDVEALKRLATEAETKQLEPSTLELLASAFSEWRPGWGDRDQSGKGDETDFRAWERRIRIRAQELHPDDFWVNVRLGSSTLGRDRDAMTAEEATKALQYLRAAVALRPTSSYALEKLGLALAKQGSPTEALAQLRRSISLDPQLRHGRAYETCREILRENEDAIERASLEELLVTLGDVVASGREYSREPLIELRAHAQFLLGRRAEAILALEEFRRSRDRSVGRGFSWSGRPGRGARPGRSGRPGRPGRPGRAGRWQLEEYREAVRPDLLSFASIDSVFDLPGSDASRSDTLARFLALHEGTAENDARARVLYLEGRELQREGRHLDAVGRFYEVVGRQNGLPEPYLRLAESLRASGEAARALATLSDALDDRSLHTPALWKLWTEVSLVDLGHSAKEALAAFPAIPSETEAPSSATYGADLLWVLERLASGKGVHINAGGDRYEGTGGITWGRDRFFTAGSFSYFDMTRRASSGPRVYFSAIKKTEDTPLYQTDRVFFSRGPSGAGGYEIPLPRGKYEVTLHFAEIFPGARDPDFKRTFDVVIEGKVARAAYDPGAQGFATAAHWSFKTTVDDGLLEVKFVYDQSQPPKISAIAVWETS